ncbi:MAG: DNA polymerase IV, partial [Deltaproteobacteria bacterium]|nr:DNA polymerase IV [Deltaproteobacteria bacterium]
SIIHLDMDAFYPAVEVLDNPALKGKPVIVGGSRERGVVSSASYEARKFGVHSAQPIVRAMRFCPKGIFLPVRMSRYRQLSRQVFEIFYQFTPLVEPLSIDEAFLDVTGSERLLGKPADIAKKIKQMVFKETGLMPDGLTVVHPDRVSDFLDPLPINKMWGIGKVTMKALTRLNIHTFRDLHQLPINVLEQKFGKQGVRMHQLSMGLDEREVVTEYDAKSIGHENTFPQDILGMNVAKEKLLSLANRVARRMRREGATGRTITLKVKYSDFVQITRSTTLQKPTDDGPEIYSTARRLLEKTEVGKRPVRLLGISLSQLGVLNSKDQLSLFHQDIADQKRKDLNKALDSLYEKFGEKSIRPGTLLNK